MLSPIDLEYRIQSAEYYFATLMDQLVEETMQLEPVDDAFVSRVDNLFYTIEAIRFLYDRGIYTDDATCLAVYQDMMDQIGINVTLPDVYVDTTLVIPGTNLPVPFQGPQGPQGPAGTQGSQGPRGFQGFQGSQGFQGPQGFQGSGVQGPQGFQGFQGPQGFQGSNGTSVVIKGAVQSVVNLPSSGNTPGDLYIVLDDGDGYVWDGAQWDNIGQIQGPQGFQGPQGAQGPQGPQGVISSGTANYVAKFTAPNAIGNSSIVDDGTTVSIPGVSTPDRFDVAGGIRLDGPLTLGGFTNTNEVFSVSRSITGNATSYGIRIDSSTSGDVTTESVYVSTHPILFNALSTLSHYKATVNFLGATVTNQSAFWATASIVGATNNYGFRASLPVGANNWNIFADGTAKNYFNGKILLGSNTDNGSDILQVTGSSTFSSSVTANSFVKSGGTAFQFLKADGTVDTNLYVTFSRTLTINGVTYDLSENRSWTIPAITGSGTGGRIPVFSTSTSISDSQIYTAFDEAIGAMIGIGATPNAAPTPHRLYVSGTSYFTNALTVNAGVVATSFIRSGGTSSQFLKADGSVDSTSYTPTSRTITINGTTFDLTANRSWTVGNITGSGTGRRIAMFNPMSGASTQIGDSAIYQEFDGGIGDMIGIGASPNSAPSPHKLYVNGNSYFNGSLSLSSNVSASGSITGSSIVRSGGTSSQFLKADGSVDSSNYALSSRNLTINGVTYDLTGDRSWSVGTVTGNGSANYVAKFNGTSSLTTGVLYDNGSALGVNTTNPLATLHVAGGFIMENQFNRRTSNYTLVLSDAGKIVETNISSTNTVTVPDNATAPFPIGTEIFVMQYGSGQTTIAPASGVTLRSKANYRKIGSPYTGACLVKVGTDEWYLVGTLVS